MGCWVGRFASRVTWCLLGVYLFWGFVWTYVWVMSTVIVYLVCVDGILVFVRGLTFARVFRW